MALSEPNPAWAVADWRKWLWRTWAAEVVWGAQAGAYHCSVPRGVFLPSRLRPGPGPGPKLEVSVLEVVDRHSRNVGVRWELEAVEKMEVCRGSCCVPEVVPYRA